MFEMVLILWMTLDINKTPLGGLTRQTSTILDKSREQIINSYIS